MQATTLFHYEWKSMFSKKSKKIDEISTLDK